MHNFIMNDAIKEKYSRAPHKPGVYIFYGKRGEHLYIGKARDIKKRLASYIFGEAPSPRIAAMLRNAVELDWIITDNELEALILEANLIRQYKPRYNVELRDDKRYPYIKITNEPFPRLTIARRKSNDGALYFGPYADRTGAVRLMRLIRRLFRIRICKYELPPKRKLRACILFDIGRCLGPCIGACTEEEYARAVDEVVMFLKGKRTELLDRLRAQMEQAADEMRFEEAARLRDTISELSKLLVPQKMDSDLGDRDFVGLAVGGGIGVAMIFRVRQGAMIARQTVPLTVPRKVNVSEALTEFLLRFYSQDPDMPPEILVSDMPTEKEEVERTLSDIRGRKVTIKVPQRGEKYETMKLVLRNAELIHGELIIQKKKVHIPYGVLELERLLNIPRTPNRIEAFDISNFGSDTIVASMVQFVAGRANKQGYRHYKIKTVVGQDDFASMREVVFRRYRRLLDEGKQLPDLILVDGGKGQLSAALQSLDKLGLKGKIPVVAIAKRLDELYLPGKSEPVSLPKDSAAIRLLQRIRDEAHRFAITYSRKSHRRKALALELMEIQGIGQKRAELLLKKFGSIKNIASASIDQIVTETKIPRKIAEKLKSELAKIVD
ncbi:excinuclease ABC subunit C [bacterium]|nr:MAG: excinuclease ABC subunit C [bacterium]